MHSHRQAEIRVNAANNFIRESSVLHYLHNLRSYQYIILKQFLLSLHLQLTNTNTHTHPFNGPLSRTIQVSRYQKGQTNLDFTEARDSEWQWHQLGRMQVCTLLQTDNHASTPPLTFFTGRMPFLLPITTTQHSCNSIFPGTNWLSRH